MDNGPQPIPPATHRGEPPTPEEELDTRLTEMMLALIFVAVFVLAGVAVQVFTHEGVICLVAAALFGIVFQLSLLVQRLRGL